MSELKVVPLPLDRRPLPTAGKVDLWISNLAAFPLAVGQTPPGTHARAQSLKFRQRFLLRLLLGSYLDCPGKGIRFEYGAAGKPALTADLAASGLQFNLSHSGDWLAIAVTQGSAVGVDIECRRELPRASALARRFLSAPEAQLIDDLAEPTRSARFLTLWARREALVKAIGGSVVASTASIALDPADGRPLTLPSDWPVPSDWTLLEPRLPAALVGALALPQLGQTVETKVLEFDAVSSASGRPDRPG
jgi:4'-phosphopantetheinyl transferase